jgi:hypothetical protein
MKSTSSFSHHELGLNINSANMNPPTSNQGGGPSHFDLLPAALPEEADSSSMAGVSSTRSQPYQPLTTRSLRDIIKEALDIIEDAELLGLLDPSPKD